MYPVSLGRAEADRRIRLLIANGHHAEALITAVFTFEKTVRRALRYMAVARGFTSMQAELLFDNMGFKNLQGIWPCFDISHRTLPSVVGNNLWQHIQPAVTMRNKLAHGERVYKLEECKVQAERVLDALTALQNELKAGIGFDGWSKMPVRRKAALPWLAQPTIQADGPASGGSAA